jgi:hypothetical protein
MGGGEYGRGRMMEEINLTKIHSKHICKYNNVSPIQLLYANKFKINIKNFRG